jgi:hypothetical protein
MIISFKAVSVLVLAAVTTASVAQTPALHGCREGR